MGALRRATIEEAGPLRKRPCYTSAMLSVLRANRLRELGFSHGFSLRAGGVSSGPYASLNLGGAVGDETANVAENHRLFADAVGYDAQRLVTLRQVHGNRVHVVTQLDDAAALRAEQGDGLVASGGAAIGIRTADCVPVLLADPATRRVAALHAGWRGIVAGVIGNTVSALTDDATQLVAAVFPHIGVCCFEVGDDVAEVLAAVAPGIDVVRRGGWRAGVAPGVDVVGLAGGRPHVALGVLVRAQLMAAGVPAAQIEDVPGCTRCDAERFFSFRRDGQQSGRHLTSIVAA
jgi:YfiH family protein